MHLQRLKDRFSKSLRFRLTLLITLLTAFLTVVFTFFYVVHERRSYLSQLESKGVLLAEILAETINVPLYAGNSEEVAHHISELISNQDIHSVTVFDSNREPFASARKNDNRSGGDYLTITRTVVSGFNSYSPEALLTGDVPPDPAIGRVELVMDTAQLQTITKKLILGSTLLAIVFWLAISSLTYFLLRKVTSTFQLLMSGVRNIEAGDLSTRLPAGEDDEPGRALAAINSLAEALQKKNDENRALQAEVVQGLRLQIDEEKNRHMAKLIQTNRMTSLGLLVSSMAHEINNPNGAIRLAAEILERAWKDVLPILNEVAEQEGELKVCGLPHTEAFDDIEVAVDAILNSSMRIETVVDNLRSYSLGTRDRRLKLFDLNRVAENAVAIVRAHGRMEGINLDLELSFDLPAVNGNPFQLEQVVINLLLNAIQAFSGGDSNRIVLSTGTEPQGGGLLLVVRDNGPGIPAANLPHIFEPFFSTRIDKGGSGLGLYIANFIVREQDGTLELRNHENGGCSATIRLPAAQAETIQPPETIQAFC